jgi:hypothetical protein
VDHRAAGSVPVLEPLLTVMRLTSPRRSHLGAVLGGASSATPARSRR